LLHVTRNNSTPGEDVVTLSTRYQKDGEEGPPILFDLVQVAATPERTSLVPVLRTKAAPAASKLTGQQQAALDVLTEMLNGGTAEVAESVWLQRCVDGRRVSASEDPKDAKRGIQNGF